MRLARIAVREVLTAGTANMMPRPQMPLNKTGRRPMRSDRAPRRGEARNCMTPKLSMIAPYHHICSSRVSVSTPIRRGKTGMMRPMPTASRKMQA